MIRLLWLFLVASPPGLSPAEDRALIEARRIAESRLEDAAACRFLFERLGADGAEVVRSLTFRPPVGEREKTTCRDERAALLTYHLRPVVIVCPGGAFAAKSPAERAVAVVHEALHAAGLAEWPPVPGAPTSAEISAVVRLWCRLETAGNL